MLRLTSENGRVLAELCATLASDGLDDPGVRSHVGEQLMRLLRADHYGSYVWDEAKGKFASAVSLHVSQAALSSYQAYYQFRDPISARLRALYPAASGVGFSLPRPMAISELIPERTLLATEYGADFLQREGMYWGINLQVGLRGESSTDVRLWRVKRRGDFEANDLAILSIVAPALRAALLRLRRGAGSAARPPTAARRFPSELPPEERPEIAADKLVRLTAQEGTVATLVAEGLTDKEIARRLGIAFSTVRSHIKSIFRKLRVQRRTGLVHMLARNEAAGRK